MKIKLTKVNNCHASKAWKARPLSAKTTKQEIAATNPKDIFEIIEFFPFKKFSKNATEKLHEKSFRKT